MGEEREGGRERRESRKTPEETLKGGEGENNKMRVETLAN